MPLLNFRAGSLSNGPLPGRDGNRRTDPFWSGATQEGASKARQATIFRTCANPHCRSGWIHLWRRRETPVFEDGWCCSRECTTARVEEALAREMDAKTSTGPLHRHRIPIGLTMLEQGWISEGHCMRRWRAKDCGPRTPWPLAGAAAEYKRNPGYSRPGAAVGLSRAAG